MNNTDTLSKDKNRADRLAKSASARLRRKERKSMIEQRTLALFSRLRKKRKTNA